MRISAVSSGALPTVRSLVLAVGKTFRGVRYGDSLGSDKSGQSEGEGDSAISRDASDVPGAGLRGAGAFCATGGGYRVASRAARGLRSAFGDARREQAFGAAGGQACRGLRAESRGAVSAPITLSNRWSP